MRAAPAGPVTRCPPTSAQGGGMPRPPQESSACDSQKLVQASIGLCAAGNPRLRWRHEEVEEAMTA